MYWGEIEQVALVQYGFVPFNTCIHTVVLKTPSVFGLHDGVSRVLKGSC